jgi:hypothetical protein
VHSSPTEPLIIKQKAGITDKLLSANLKIKKTLLYIWWILLKFSSQKLVSGTMHFSVNLQLLDTVDKE